MMNDQDEMFERGTETPAFLGCPQHMPTHLPGGFDGVEPEQKKRSDLEKMNNLLRNRLRKISDIADKAVMGIRTDEGHNIALLGACTEIRQLVDFYKPSDKPLDPSAPEMKPQHKGKLFKSKHTSSCRGTYIYDRVVINGAHLRADLHYDNGGLEQHGSVYVDDRPGAFCFVTFNTSGATKCDYAMRGLLAGIAKRLVYHHKNLIKRKAKWADAKAAKKGGAK